MRWRRWRRSINTARVTDLHGRAAVRALKRNSGRLTRSSCRPNVSGRHRPHLHTSLSSTPPPSPSALGRPCSYNVAPPGGQRTEAGGGSSPGRVRRGPITFRCCFSALCKEQSALIAADCRRILIQRRRAADGTAGGRSLGAPLTE